MFKTDALIHSLKRIDEVTIISQTDNNHVVAEYKGVRYSAIYNPFVGLYYVDDLYGRSKNGSDEATRENETN